MSDDNEPTTGTRSIPRIVDFICGVAVGFAVGCLSFYAVSQLRHRSLLIYQMNLPCLQVLFLLPAPVLALQTKVYCKRIGQLCVKACTDVFSSFFPSI